MRPHRHLMDPSNPEMLVMFRFNRNLWDEILDALNFDSSRSRLQGTPTPTTTTPLDLEMS